jgi:hypothetical protein
MEIYLTEESKQKIEAKIAKLEGNIGKSIKNLYNDKNIRRSSVTKNTPK